MKEYSFIDMHIHTKFSDEELCDMSIEQLLEKAEDYAITLGNDCVISISDHNTILGAKKAKQILVENPEKYPHVKLINGIEFTTDLTELKDHLDGENTFTRCHTLMYGYDENNKELIAYSKVAHKHFSLDDNIGLQIMSARRAVCEQYKIKIPFSTYLGMADLPRAARYKQEFVNITSEYLKKHGLPARREDIEKLVEPYIDNKVSYNQTSSSFGKLRLSEIAQLAKESHGKLVIAHPALINTKVSSVKKLATKHGKEHDDIFFEHSKNNFVPLESLKDKKFVFEHFLDAYEKVCGFKIYGIEKFYTANMKSRLDKDIDEICKQRNYFQTVGSDYHGEHLNPDRELGCFLNKKIISIYYDRFPGGGPSRNPIVISAIASAQDLLGESVPGKQSALIKGIDGSVIPEKEFDSIIDKYHQKQRYRVENKAIFVKYDILTKINEINNIIKRLNLVANEINSSDKKIRMFNKISYSCVSVVKGLDEFKELVKVNPKTRYGYNYRLLCKTLNQAKSAFEKVLISDPEIIKNVKKTYRIQAPMLFIERMAQIKLPAPLDVDKEK